MQLLFWFLKMWYLMTFKQKSRWTFELWFKEAIIYINGVPVSSKNLQEWQYFAIVKE